MKLSMACASFSLPSCYLGVVGVNDAFANGDIVCCIAFSWSIYISLNPLSPLHFPYSSLSLSQYRAIFCQRCGVGSSHLLLLQRDSHGVQLPGEGIDMVKSHPPFPLNCRRSHRGAACPFRASFKKKRLRRGICDRVAEMQRHERRRWNNISLQLIFGCQYQVFSHSYSDLSS